MNKSWSKKVTEMWPEVKKRILGRHRAKTPTVIQMEMVECGAAALGSILAYHGSYIPLEELRTACGVNRDGSKASNMLKAARKYGLVAKGYRQEPAGLRNMPLPAIVHWNFNHFVVLEGFYKDTVYLNDPATGPRTVSAQEFDEAFTGVVLTFTTAENFQPQGKKPSLLSTLLPQLSGVETALTFVVLISLVLVIPGLLIPAFSQVFVDYYLGAGRHEWMIPLLIGMVLTAVLRSALTWMQQRYLLRLETRLALTKASQLTWHILRLPIEFFSQRGAGDISTRIEQNDRVAELLSGDLATTLLNVILIGFYAILMFQYSVTLTVIGIVMAALNFVALRAVGRRRKDVNQRLVQEQGKLSSTTFNSLTQIETVKSTGREADSFATWAGYQAKVFNANQELGATTKIVNVVPFLLTQVTTVVILVVGAFLILDGRMTAGILVAFQTLMASFLAPVNQVVGLGTQLQEIDGIVRRLNDVANYEPDPRVHLADATIDTSQPMQKLMGSIEIRNLTFGYSRLSPPLIQDFNLRLEPGMRVALVGGSGSGKSTIARLVAGLYLPWDGQILFDGREREEFPRAIISHSLRIVDQELFLFEGSVRDNLTMWDKQIPEEAVIRAAKDAHIHNEITAQAAGYDHLIEEEGRNFSGGQRQRLEIARALVSNPSILILDEATSALDPITEKIIDGNLRRRGCTCLIVAHRLSTIRDCDEIIVLNNGQVVERGTHEELWRRGGEYTRLIKAETPESERLLDSILEKLYV
jgi:NHLM bacteriocin system ABC transporter peptidase/ATP-binding protein